MDVSAFSYNEAGLVPCIVQDADTLLALVNPAGPACHTGARSCFYRVVE